MRRKDREITEVNEIISVIEKCDCCRIAFNDDDYPYIVPMNFGFKCENNIIELYFHCAGEGKKTDLILKNPKVAFEMDCSHKLITGENACDYTMEYESVIGFGSASFIDENKAQALDIIMRKYSSQTEFKYDEKRLGAVRIFKITVKSITGKRLKK